MAEADLILENAVFRTMVSENDVAEAVAVRDGRIIAVGGRREIRKLAGSTTVSIDCGAATGFPGFTDVHTHLLGAAKERCYEINFDAEPPCRSIADVQRKIRAKVAGLAAGAWVTGGQVRDERYAERRYPTRRDLDAAAPDNPVYVRSTGSHITCVNSAALALAGVDRNTPDPPGGVIERDPSGEPTGVLRERARLLFTDGDRPIIPAYTIDESVAALEATAPDILLRNGITSVGTMVVDNDEIRAHQVARRRGRFPVRTKLQVRVIESGIALPEMAAVGLMNGFGDELLHIGGVKISVDGGSLQKNAALYEAYPGEPDNVGVIRIEQQELDQTIAAAHRCGLRPMVHAIGDRAYDMTLLAFDRAGTRAATDHRSRMEHFGNLPVTAKQLESARRMGVIASVQPQFLAVYGDKWVDIFGEERAGGILPLRTMLDAGVRVVGSSDHGMTTTNPLVGVQAVVTRRTGEGTLVAPEQAISVYEALRMYTVDAAWSDFEEHRRGTIEVGKAADLSFVARDPMTAETDRIAEIPVTMTVIAGSVAFRVA